MSYFLPPGRWAKLTGMLVVAFSACLMGALWLCRRPRRPKRPKPRQLNRATWKLSLATSKSRKRPTLPRPTPMRSDAHAATASHTEGHGGHHDPYDLSHQNAGPKLDDPSQWKSDLALASLVVFVVIVAFAQQVRVAARHGRTGGPRARDCGEH